MYRSILIFGAGKIGRSFIGQLFSRSGYEVIFSDVDVRLVENINVKKAYPLIIKGEKEERILIRNVRAINGRSEDEVIQAIESCSLVATSVGKNAIDTIIPILAKGILKRYKADTKGTLDIIITENMKDAAEYVREGLRINMPSNFPFHRIGLIETSIDKMVPVIPEQELEKDPLIVFAEPYNELIIDKKAFKGEIPDIEGLALKEHIKAWVDRKSYIHNLGLATAAYFGYYKHPDNKYIYEVLEDREVYDFVRNAMLQSASVLEKLYPKDFTRDDLIVYVDDLLRRFQNKSLKDTVFRVGKDRIRKLGPDDRFVGIIRLAMKTSLEYDQVLRAMVYSFHFQATYENGVKSAADILFDKYLSQGIEFVLQRISGLNPVKDAKLIKQFINHYEEAKQLSES